MANKNPISTIGVFGLFSLVMITVGAVDSIRNLPAAALFGSSLVFFFLIGAIIFLIPSTLIAAELVTTWPECGGVYIWVKQAFGKNFGFLAVWLQWIENVIWFPTILSFIAGSIGYLISPSLVDNKIFLITVILTSFWLVTMVNLRGIKSSVILGNFCTIFGLLLPISLIIILGVDRLFTGHAEHLASQLHSFKPTIENPQMWIALTGIMLSFCGLEITTVHAHEVRNPHHNFPRALFISTGLLLITLILGSLAIAWIVPKQQLGLLSGVMQTFDNLFGSYHLQWVMPLVAVALVLGALGGISSWIIAPTRGLLIAAHDGHLPKNCTKQNKHGAPHTLLLYQAIIVSIIILVFWLIPSANGSYWLLTVMAAQLYMLMYILMFAAAIYLRFIKPKQKRPFRIPGGKIGICIVGGLGIMGALMTFTIGFIPPHNINTGGTLRYELILIAGLILASLPPLISFKKFNQTISADSDFITTNKAVKKTLNKNLVPNKN